jgi:hypothetical protein
MLIRSFFDAHWSPAIIEELRASGCAGVEIIARPSMVPSSPRMPLAEIGGRVEKIIPTAEYWLISGHEIPQPKSRIVDYKKFWRSFEISLPLHSSSVAEWCVSTPVGPKFYGIVKKSLLQEKDFIYLWSRLKTTWLVAMGGAHSAKELMNAVRSGWGG